MSEHSPATELLGAELPDARFEDDAYLRWLYDENPHGLAIQRNVDDASGRRVAHYALIPQEYRGPEGPVRCMFSLNAVTRSGHQRAGHFRRIGLEIYDEAATAGFRFTTGVSNDKSVGAVVKYMGWRHWGPLPVRIIAPVRRWVGGFEHHEVDPDFLEGQAFVRIATGLDLNPSRGFANRWSPEFLRWRLARPRARYCVHATDELVAVSTTDRRFGVRAAIILKLLPRTPRTEPISASRMIAGICRYHRAPVAAYAGMNVDVRVRGIAPPRRLQPSPLHLIIRHLDPTIDQDSIELGSFEFLDGDAY